MLDPCHCNISHVLLLSGHYECSILDITKFLAESALAEFSTICGCREFQIAEFGITESAIAEFGIISGCRDS